MGENLDKGRCSTERGGRDTQASTGGGERYATGEGTRTALEQSLGHHEVACRDRQVQGSQAPMVPCVEGSRTLGFERRLRCFSSRST